MSLFHDHDDHEVIRSTHGKGDTFQSIMERRLSRRDFLKGTAAASAVVIAASAFSGETTETVSAQLARPNFSFEAISPQPASTDQVVVPDTYRSSVLLRWGDPIMADAPEFDVENQTADAQAKQFGYNNDYVGFMPLPFGSRASDRGLLVVNHEYTNPDIMFPGYDAENPNPTSEQVDIELNAHGLSVVEIERDSDGNWSPNLSSRYNRRITAFTPMNISGPAAGHEWLQTTEDPSGNDIRGTLNNCAGGQTPWGTVVSAEENFHQYFANHLLMDDDDPRKEVHDRYGLPAESSNRRWEEFYDRFDLSKEANEAFRFGWAVEVDPYDPESTPVKRSSIGRFRHEAQTFVVTPSGQVAVYSGDDARFEYIYKFVTDGTYNPDNREANLGLLDEGTLYVAKFNEDGSGEWMPLVYGEGPLTEENGFTSQADVLIKTRQAGDALGATKMDRPEDIEPNPVNQKVYIALTNNTQRGTEGKADPNAMNPRAENAYGHMIELTEENDDHTATSFNWEIFLLCGDPDDESTYFAGFPKDQVSPISNPDNVAFDNAGNLWIATDGQPRTLEYTDGLFAVPVSGAERGFVRQFFGSVAGSEVCGPEFTPDNTTLFLAIQHPGEGGTFEDPVSTWPDGEVPPRPSLVTVQSVSGGPLGMVESSDAAATSGGGSDAAAAAPTATAGDGGGTSGAPGDTGGNGDAPESLPETGGSGSIPWWLGAAGLGAALGGALLRRRNQASTAGNAEAQGDNTDA